MRRIHFFMLLTLAGAAALAADRAAGQAARPDQLANKPPEKAAAAVERKIPVEKLNDLEHPVAVARYAGNQVLTNVDIHRAHIALKRGTKATFSQMLSDNPETQLKPFIEMLVLNRIFLEQSKKDDQFKPPTDLQDRLKQMTQQKVQGLIYQELIEPNLPEVTDELIQAYYNDRSDEYNTPFSFKIRSIFLMTYEPYTVVEGDTLESIATKISGDAALAGRILSDETKKPRAATPVAKSSQGDSVLDQPLKPGEKLLAPMNEVNAGKVRQRMEEIEKQLKTGSDFVGLAAKFSEDEQKGDVSDSLPQGKEKVIPDILKAAMKLPADGISEILRTKHGFQIVKVVEKHEARVTPLSQVQEKIRKEMLQQARKQTIEQFWAKVMLTPELKFDLQALMNNGAQDDTRIATLGDVNYTWADLRAETRRGGVPAGQEERLAKVRESFKLRQKRIELLSAEPRFSKHPELVWTMELTEGQMIAQQYLTHKIEREVKITPEQLREFYEKSKMRYVEQGKYRIYEIAKQPGVNAKSAEEAMAELTEIKAKISSLEDFQRIAATEVNLESFREKKGDRGEMTHYYRGPEFMQAIDKLELKKVHGPFNTRGEIFLVWIDAQTDKRVPTLDEIKTRIETDFRRSESRTAIEPIKKQALELAKIEYLY